MGRAGGFAASPAQAGGPERRGRLSVVRNGAGPPHWGPTTLERLVRALDLRSTAPCAFEATAVEADWPSFPGALLLASAVVAAERSFPGYSVGHLSCAFGQHPRSGHPVDVDLSEVHRGTSCITARMTFRQCGTAHGEVAVVLRSAAAALAGDPPPRRGRMAQPPVPVAAAAGPAVAIVPWEVQSVPAPDPSGGGPDRCSWTWSRPRGAPADGTLQRALLVYLSELLPIASAGVPYPSPGDAAGLSATVLNHAITYGAPFDLRDGLLAAVEGPVSAEGYVHTLATFRTRRGRTAARVSQAAAVWDQEPGRGLVGRGRQPRRLMLSG
jgi:acyl-CoA thioesterase